MNERPDDESNPSEEIDGDESPEDSHPRTPILETDASPDSEPVDEVPLNRAERRARMRRERRGTADPVDRNAEAAAAARPRVPPRTMTGKTNADEIPPWARSIQRWYDVNKGPVLAGIAVVTLGVGGWLGTTSFLARRHGAAAMGIHQAAIQLAAGLRPAEAPADPNASRSLVPRYTDAEARARAALQAAQQIESGKGSDEAARVARLEQGVALYDLRRFAEAKAILEPLRGQSLGGLEPRLLESLGFTQEALNDLPGALRTFEELARYQDGNYRDLADYHQSRVLRAQNQDTRAKDMLHALIERLRRAHPADPLGLGANVSVLEQSRALLRDIDPADPAGRSAEAGMEQIQELLRQLQQRGGGGAAGGT